MPWERVRGLSWDFENNASWDNGMQHDKMDVKQDYLAQNDKILPAPEKLGLYRRELLHTVDVIEQKRNQGKFQDVRNQIKWIHHCGKELDKDLNKIQAAGVATGFPPKCLTPIATPRADPFCVLMDSPRTPLCNRILGRAGRNPNLPWNNKFDKTDRRTEKEHKLYFKDRGLNSAHILKKAEAGTGLTSRTAYLGLGDDNKVTYPGIIDCCI
eukprot:g6463.t1